MNEPAIMAMSGRPLRVRVFAADPARRAKLCDVLRVIGHDVVDAHDTVDVVLADGGDPVVGDRPVVALGGDDTDHAGLLARDADANQIDAAVRAVAAGLIVRSRGSASAGFRALNDVNLQALLTPREIEILDAIGRGLTNKAISRRLNISPHTVKFHVESLFRKLGVRTRSEAVARASELLRSTTLEI